jgi:hypothetical protein
VQYHVLDDGTLEEEIPQLTQRMIDAFEEESERSGNSAYRECVTWWISLSWVPYVKYDHVLSVLFANSRACKVAYVGVLPVWGGSFSCGHSIQVPNPLLDFYCV